LLWLLLWFVTDCFASKHTLMGNRTLKVPHWKTQQWGRNQ
jgi:hypothetical protein